jgi:inorganic triphosphatase YgiF
MIVSHLMEPSRIDMATETELKILLDEDGMRALRQNRALGAMSTGKPRQINLHARYFDTECGALGKHGIALRVRREGRSWVQTVKAGRGVSAGLSSVSEVSCPAPGGKLRLDALPDAALREAIAEAAGTAPLAARFETVIRRRVHDLRSPLGGLVEVALDSGEIRAGERAAELHEAELELKQGDPRDLYAVAEALIGDRPLRLSRRNKAQRGAALAAGGSAVDTVPPIVFAAPIRLEPTMSSEAAARDVLRGCLDQIAGNVAACAVSTDPKAPHQLRVGLRRLRTALSMFRPVIGGPALAALAAQAATLATTVGALRDLDVLAEDILAPLAPAEPGFTPLLAAVADHRATARRAIGAAVQAPETTRFILRLGAFTEGRGWLDPGDFAQSGALARPVATFAAEALEKRWKKAARLGAEIETLDIEARHELRKALKKLRYVVEFTASLWPERKVKPFLKALKRLQSAFGALQDSAMARALLTGPRAPARDDIAAQRAVGYTLGHREAEATLLWRDARADWAALKAAPRYWR